MAGTDAPGTDARMICSACSPTPNSWPSSICPATPSSPRRWRTRRLGEMAVAEFGHFRALHDELTKRGAVPEQAMEPFVAPGRLPCQDGPRGLARKPGQGLCGGRARGRLLQRGGRRLEPQARALVLEVLADTGHADFVISRVRAAIEADPSLAGGSRCGRGGWSARRWRRRTAWWRSGRRWPTWSPARMVRRAGRAISGGCSRASPMPTTSGSALGLTSEGPAAVVTGPRSRSSAARCR